MMKLMRMKVTQIQNSQDTTAYYIGYYQGDNLIKFEKYINQQKVFAFSYTYNAKGKLVKVNQEKFDE